MTGVDKLLLAAWVNESGSSPEPPAVSSAQVSAASFSMTTATTTPHGHGHHHHHQHHQSYPQIASQPILGPSGTYHHSVQPLQHQLAQPQQHHQPLPQPMPAPLPPYVPIGRGIGCSYGSLLTSRDPMMHIPTPRNKSELELYSLLERANLLNYFGTFLNFGGDDVQQISDADEDEFLEIMSLIGMTQKPLHVRRLQKALIEWREGRELFRRPNSLAPASSQQQAVNSTYQPIHHYHTPSQASQAASMSQGHDQQLHFGYGSTQSVSDGNQETNNERNHSRSSTTIMVESPAPTPNSSSSRGASIASKPQYCAPHEVLIGAPKRPRLMDSIKPRDFSKIQHESPMNDMQKQSFYQKQVLRIHQQRKSGLCRPGKDQPHPQPDLVGTAAVEVQHQQPTDASSLNQSYEDDSKQSPASVSVVSPDHNPSSPRLFESASPESEGEVSDHDQAVCPKRESRSKPSVRTSLLARFHSVEKKAASRNSHSATDSANQNQSPSPRKR